MPFKQKKKKQLVATSTKRESVDLAVETTLLALNANPENEDGDVGRVDGVWYRKIGGAFVPLDGYVDVFTDSATRDAYAPTQAQVDANARYLDATTNSDWLATAVGAGGLTRLNEETTVVSRSDVRAAGSTDTSLVDETGIRTELDLKAGNDVVAPLVAQLPLTQEHIASDDIHVLGGGSALEFYQRTPDGTGYRWQAFTVNSANTVSGHGDPSTYAAGTPAGDATDGFYYEEINAPLGTNNIWGPKVGGTWPAQADGRSAEPETGSIPDFTDAVERLKPKSWPAVVNDTRYTRSSSNVTNAENTLAEVGGTLVKTGGSVNPPIARVNGDPLELGDFFDVAVLSKLDGGNDVEFNGLFTSPVISTNTPTRNYAQQPALLRRYYLTSIAADPADNLWNVPVDRPLSVPLSGGINNGSVIYDGHYYSAINGTANAFRKLEQRVDGRYVMTLVSGSSTEAFRIEQFDMGVNPQLLLENGTVARSITIELDNAGQEFVIEAAGIGVNALWQVKRPWLLNASAAIKWHEDDTTPALVGRLNIYPQGTDLTTIVAPEHTTNAEYRLRTADATDGLIDDQIQYLSNGKKGVDGAYVLAVDSEVSILDSISIPIRSAGTNAGSNVTFSVDDREGNTYPPEDWVYSGTFTQYTGGTAVVTYDRRTTTNALGLGRNKAGVATLHYVGDKPNGHSAIRVTGANGGSINGPITVEYEGTNRTNVYASVAAVGPMNWTTVRSFGASDQAAPLIDSTEYPEKSVFSWIDPEETDSPWFNWRVKDGETLLATEFVNGTDAEFIAIKPKLDRFGIGTKDDVPELPDWYANEWKVGNRVIAPMPANADFISDDGAILNVKYIFEAVADRPITVTQFDDTEADSGAWELVGQYQINGTDDRVITGAGIMALDPLTTLSNSAKNEFIHWTTVDDAIGVIFTANPAFITTWKDYTGEAIVQPVAVNDQFTIPANSQMWVHRAGNSLSFTFESSAGGVATLPPYTEPVTAATATAQNPVTGQLLLDYNSVQVIHDGMNVDFGGNGELFMPDPPTDGNGDAIDSPEIFVEMRGDNQVNWTIEDSYGVPIQKLDGSGLVTAIQLPAGTTWAFRMNGEDQAWNYRQVLTSSGLIDVLKDGVTLSLTNPQNQSSSGTYFSLDPVSWAKSYDSINVASDTGTTLTVTPEIAGAYTFFISHTAGAAANRVAVEVNGTEVAVSHSESSSDGDAGAGAELLKVGDTVRIRETTGNTAYGVHFLMVQKSRFIDETQYVNSEQLLPVQNNSRIVATGFGPSGGTANADITTFTVPEDGDYEYETNVEGFQSSVLAWNKTLQVRDAASGGGNLIMSEALSMGASATIAVRKMASPKFGTVTLQTGVTYTTRLIHANEFTDQLSPVTLILRKVPNTVEAIDTDLIPADTTQVGTPLQAGSDRHYVMQWDGTKLVNTLAMEVWTEGTLGNSGYRKYMVDHLTNHARISGRNVITSSGTISWNLDFAIASGYVFAHDLREAQAETASMRINSRTLNSLNYTLHDSVGTGDSGSNVQFELSGEL